MESRKKTDVPTGLDGAVLTSFATILPSIFVGGKKVVEGGVYDALEGYLKTSEIWKPRGRQTGVGQQVLDGVHRVSSRATNLRAATIEDPDALLLSSGLCQDSERFCRELVQFMDEQVDEMKRLSAYSEEDIWSMQLECLQKILEELNEAREGVADAALYQHGLFLWGMLRAWKVQQRYLSCHFKDDPALTGIFVRRIVMHGEDETISEKFKAVEIWKHKTEDQLRQLNSDSKKCQEFRKSKAKTN